MTGYVETPASFGEDGRLVGCVCEPIEAPGREPPVAVFVNAGIIHRVGPNRLYVRMARALAGAGIPSLRFDLSGLGDSRHPEGGGSSIQEHVRGDLREGLAFARRRTARRPAVMIGLCSGADNAVRSMVSDDEVVGSVLLDLNTHLTPGFHARRYADAMARPASWLRLAGRLFTDEEEENQEDRPTDTDERLLLMDSVLPPDLLRESLQAIVDRGGRLLSVFTGGLRERYNYREQILDLAPALRDREEFRLEYWSEVDHTFSRRAHQDRLIELVLGWLGSTWPAEKGRNGEAEASSSSLAS